MNQRRAPSAIISHGFKVSSGLASRHSLGQFCSIFDMTSPTQNRLTLCGNADEPYLLQFNHGQMHVICKLQRIIDRKRSHIETRRKRSPSSNVGTRHGIWCLDARMFDVRAHLIEQRESFRGTVLQNKKEVEEKWPWSRGGRDRRRGGVLCRDFCDFGLHSLFDIRLYPVRVLLTPAHASAYSQRVCGHRRASWVLSSPLPIH